MNNNNPTYENTIGAKKDTKLNLGFHHRIIAPGQPSPKQLNPVRGKDKHEKNQQYRDLYCKQFYDFVISISFP